MTSTESFDGLCGIIADFTYSDLQLRCTHEIGHHGPCSFMKYKNNFRFTAGSFTTPGPEQGFIDSVIFHKK